MLIGGVVPAAPEVATEKPAPKGRAPTLSAPPVSYSESIIVVLVCVARGIPGSSKVTSDCTDCA